MRDNNNQTEEVAKVDSIGEPQMAEMAKPKMPQPEFIDVSDLVCQRIARLILDNPVQAEFINQHLQDKHGVDLQSVKGVQLMIRVAK